MIMRSMIAAAAIAFAGSAFADEKANAINPQKAGPTEAVSGDVPKMTSDADDSRPATDVVGDSIPEMTPDEAAKDGKGAKDTSG